MSGHEEGAPVRYWLGAKEGPGCVGAVLPGGVKNIHGIYCQLVTGSHVIDGTWAPVDHIEPLPAGDGRVHVNTMQEAFDLCDHVETDIVIDDKDEEAKMLHLAHLMRNRP